MSGVRSALTTVAALTTAACLVVGCGKDEQRLGGIGEPDPGDDSRSGAQADVTGDSGPIELFSTGDLVEINALRCPAVEIVAEALATTVYPSIDDEHHLEGGIFRCSFGDLDPETPLPDDVGSGGSIPYSTVQVDFSGIPIGGDVDFGEMFGAEAEGSTVYEPDGIAGALGRYGDGAYLQGAPGDAPGCGVGVPLGDESAVVVNVIREDAVAEDLCPVAEDLLEAFSDASG